MRIALLLFVILVSSCTPKIEGVQSSIEGSQSNEPFLDLDGTAWELVAASRDGVPYETVPADRLWFSNDDGVSIRSCNSCNGLYTVEENQISFVRLACTRMACRPDQFQLETMIGESSSFRVEEGNLILQNATFVLHFEPIDMPESN